MKRNTKCRSRPEHRDFPNSLVIFSLAPRGQVTLALSSAQPILGKFFFWLYELRPRAQPKLNSRRLDTWLGQGAGADGRPPVEGVAVNQQLPSNHPSAA